MTGHALVLTATRARPNHPRSIDDNQWRNQVLIPDRIRCDKSPGRTSRHIRRNTECAELPKHHAPAGAEEDALVLSDAAIMLAVLRRRCLINPHNDCHYLMIAVWFVDTLIFSLLVPLSVGAK